jgi:hypothetical protein
VNVNPVNDVRVERPLRILGMIANPGSEEWPRLDAEVERERIEQSLQDVPKAAIHFEWVRGGRLDDLFEMMQHPPWHIFHFIGHGGTERYLESGGQPRNRAFVVMQDGRGGSTRVSGSDLAVALDDGVGHLRLAVLNCCDSGRGSSGFSSIGATLVASSTVPLAIAMQFAISNGAAARFAGMFYKTLVAGQPVERALTVARRFVRGQSTVEWGIPVLFTRSGSCVLFNIEPREDSGGTPVSPATSSSMASDRRAGAREELRRLFA